MLQCSPIMRSRSPPNFVTRIAEPMVDSHVVDTHVGCRIKRTPWVVIQVPFGVLYYQTTSNKNEVAPREDPIGDRLGPARAPLIQAYANGPIAWIRYCAAS